jgi:hypothetical protein
MQQDYRKGIRILSRAGMPRILLSSAHIAPLVLDAIGFEHRRPQLAASFPDLPEPFHATAERVAKLNETDLREPKIKAFNASCILSAKKPWCDAGRIYTSPPPSLPSVEM